MDPSVKKELERRIIENVQMLLSEGDSAYLRGLSRSDLLEVLESELRFLGLYAHEDQEAAAFLHAYLNQHLDEWIKDYLPESSALASSASVGIVKTTTSSHHRFVDVYNDPEVSWTTVEALEESQ